MGYLGYYLHYRDTQRKIIGIDYDDHKIKIAQNGYDKTDQLLFLHGDIRNLEIENADVVLFNDVLHYMSSAQQLQVLEKTLEIFRTKILEKKTIEKSLPLKAANSPYCRSNSPRSMSGGAFDQSAGD